MFFLSVLRVLSEQSERAVYLLIFEPRRRKGRKGVIGVLTKERQEVKFWEIVLNSFLFLLIIHAFPCVLRVLSERERTGGLSFNF